MLEIGVLGPFVVSVDGLAIHLGTPKQQCVLALLALRHGRPVSTQMLIDELWPDGPPASAEANLTSYASNIRRLLVAAGADASTLSRRGTGWVLSVPPERLDLARFTAACHEARRTSGREDDKATLAQLELAHSLWRGSPLEDLRHGPVTGAISQAIVDDHLVLVDDLAEVRLRLGFGTAAATLLHEHLRLHPLRERAYHILMRAHRAVGDTAGALDVFERARSNLATHLGVSPGAQLRDLHRLMLAEDRADPAPSEGDAKDRLDVATQPAVEPQPAMDNPVPLSWLPRAVSEFTGRSELIGRLLASLEPPGNARPATVWLLDGMPGVGKTALAIQLARMLKDRYPSGQLYIDLRGHIDAPPMDTTAAAAELLRQVGYSPMAMPSDEDGRSALWREHLADNRCFVVLDNAGNSRQIEPLLSDSPNSLIVVTSRRRLSDALGDIVETLPTLSEPEAIEMLGRLAGRQRIAAEPQAAAQIVRACGNLPLAIRLAGARLRHRTAWSIHNFADRLVKTGVLAQLSAEDRNVAAAFSGSYKNLPDASQRAFRALGILPVEDVTAESLAATMCIGLEPARDVLDDLADSNMIDEWAAGRYRIHDLLSIYAKGLANAVDPTPTKSQWITSLLEHYAAVLVRGNMRDDVENFMRYFGDLPVGKSEILPDTVGQEWFNEERNNLFSIIRSAENLNQDRLCALVSLAMWRFIYNYGGAGEVVESQSVALAAGERLGNPRLVAAAHNLLANGFYAMGRSAAAESHLVESIKIWKMHDDWDRVYNAMGNLAAVQEFQGRVPQAIATMEEILRKNAHQSSKSLANGLSNLGGYYLRVGNKEKALRMQRIAVFHARQTGDLQRVVETIAALGVTLSETGRVTSALRILKLAAALKRRWGTEWADLLNQLAVVHRKAGAYDEAERHHRAALALCESNGDEYDLAETLNDMARTRLASGGDGAMDLFERALRLSESTGHALEQARANDGLATCVVRTDSALARNLWTRACALYETMGMPEQADVRQRLAELT